MPAISFMKSPQQVFLGEAPYAELLPFIQGKRVQRVLLCTDANLLKIGLADALMHFLKENDIRYEVVDNVQPEPTVDEVQAVLDKVEADFDAVIAIGGGSVIDTAKLISVLYDSGKSARDLLKSAAGLKKQRPCIAIPTTCGTGAEATPNAIVAIPEQQVKQGIVSEILIPDAVVLDTLLVKNLPLPTLAATAVDALAHCVECFTSNKANKFSDVFAGAGAIQIFHNIRKAYSDPTDLEAREKLLLGSYFGGMAITSSGTTAVHALSYPLGGKFHIAHGVSNAILFEQVMRVNQPAVIDELGRLCDLVYPECVSQTSAEKSEKIINEIKDIIVSVNIPTDLKKFGVTEADLDFLIKEGSQQKRLLDNNKKELTLAEIEAIYRSVL